MCLQVPQRTQGSPAWPRRSYKRSVLSLFSLDCSDSVLWGDRLRRLDQEDHRQVRTASGSPACRGGRARAARARSLCCVLIPGIRTSSPAPRPWEPRASASPSSPCARCRPGRGASAAGTPPSTTPCSAAATEGAAAPAPSPARLTL